MKKKSNHKKGEVWLDGETPKKFFNNLMKKKEAQEAFLEEEAVYNFIEEVKHEMKARHLTYYAIAKKAGINHQAIAWVLKGAKDAKLSTLSKIAYGMNKKLVLKLV